MNLNFKTLPDNINESVESPHLPLIGGANENSSKSIRIWQIGNF